MGPSRVFSRDDNLELGGANLVDASLEGNRRNLGGDREGETIGGLDDRPGPGGMLASALLNGGELVDSALGDLGSAVLGNGLHGARLKDVEGVAGVDC